MIIFFFLFNKKFFSKLIKLIYFNHKFLNQTVPPLLVHVEALPEYASEAAGVNIQFALDAAYLVSTHSDY